MRRMKVLPILLGSLFILSLYGCDTPETEPIAAPTTSSVETVDDHSDHDHGEHGEHDAIDADLPMAKMMSGLKELSPEDHKSAMDQHMCPVSGEMLGTMGAPEKVDVHGKSVWICCDGCKEKLLADPDKYLANLNKD